ncbi:MAG: hypothetical protein ABIR80_19225, partial [Opitutaceae bacterium]
IRGTVEGTLIALNEAAEVTVERGAEVKGDLVLPADKTGAKVDGKNKISDKARVTLGETGAVKGQQRVEKEFKLPRGENAKAPTGTDSVTLQTEKGGEPDFAKLKNLTVRNDKREVALPPGAYGDLVVERGRVVLGQAGSPVPVRYHFQSLTIGKDGQVDLAGQAIVIVNALGAIDGQLGNKKFSNWLELRVAGGAVAFAASSEVHGVVTAAESAVTLGRGATLRGGLVCDQAVVESTSLFTGLRPDWSKESSGNSLPRFIHKAARLESRLPDLQEIFKLSHAATVEYAEDVPKLTLTEKSRPADRFEQHVERQAFFQACCALFDGTGFAEGRLKLIRTSQDAKRATAPIDIGMERHLFENHLRAIGGVAEARENIRRIRDSSLLLNLFMERALKVAANPRVNR